MPSGHERPFPDLPVRELLAEDRTLRASTILYNGTLINLYVPVSGKLISVGKCRKEDSADIWNCFSRAAVRYKFLLFSSCLG